MQEAARRSPNDRRPRRACQEVGGKAPGGVRRSVRLPEGQDGGSSALVVMYGRVSRLGFQVPGGPLVSHAVSGPLPPNLLGPAPPPTSSSRTAAGRGRPSRPPRKSARSWTSAIPPGLSPTRWPSLLAHWGRGRPHAREADDEDDDKGVHRSASWGALVHDRGGTAHPTIQQQPLAARPSRHHATPRPGLTVENPTGG